MGNCPEYLEMLLACWYAGLICAPLNAKLHPKEVAYVVEHAQASLLFTTDDLYAGVSDWPARFSSLREIIQIGTARYGELLEAAPSAREDMHEDDVAWLFYTSGTTGRPKGAMLTHRNLLAMSLRYFADIEEVDHTHCYLHAAPMSHGGGLYGLPHLMKGSHHVVPSSRGFDPGEIYALLERYANVTFYTAPTMLSRLVNHPAASSVQADRIRTIYYGGAPMYVEDLKRALQVFGPRLYQIYAQGESPNTGTGLSKALHVDREGTRYEQRLGSVGTARLGVDVRVVDGDRNEVPRGTLGEVQLRSDVLMKGYWNDPQATAAALVHGWLCTGDIGFLDEDGFLTLRDRSKDVIISGGSNIYPREVEEVLLMDHRVLEVSVLGRPHADWGEEVVAFVAVRDSYSVDEAELDQLCLANLARFKRPKKYFFVEALPKSHYGKILKSELRKIAATFKS